MPCRFAVPGQSRRFFIRKTHYRQRLSLLSRTRSWLPNRRPIVENLLCALGWRYGQLGCERRMRIGVVVFACQLRDDPKLLALYQVSRQTTRKLDTTGKNFPTPAAEKTPTR